MPARDMEPDYKTFNQLLDQGFDPNERFQGHAIWEHTVYRIYPQKDMLYQESKIICWLDAFKAMLIHGADPDACCLHDSGDFYRAIDLIGRPNESSNWMMGEHTRIRCYLKSQAATE